MGARHAPGWLRLYPYGLLGCEYELRTGSIDSVRTYVSLPLAWCSVRSGTNTTVCCELILLDAGDPLEVDKLPTLPWREMRVIRQ